jgi:hypothetical protein
MGNRCYECNQRPEDGCMSGCQRGRAIEAETELARVRAIVGEVLGDVEKMGGRYRFVAKLHRALPEKCEDGDHAPRVAIPNTGVTHAYRCACGAKMHTPAWQNTSDSQERKP